MSIHYSLTKTMANDDLNAQENSGFLALMRKEGVNDPFAYAMTRNTMHFANSKVQKSTTKQIGTSDVQTFEIHRSGVLKELWLEFTATGAADTGTLAPFCPLALFSRFELRTRDRTIATLYPETIIDWYNSQSAFTQEMLGKPNVLSAYERAANLTTPEVFRVPLPFSYIADMRQSFFTKFTEPMEVHVYSASTSVGACTTSTIAMSNASVKQLFAIPHPSSEARIVEELRKVNNNQGPAKLQWSVYKEADATLSSGGNEVTIDVKCPYPAWRTVIVSLPAAHVSGSDPGHRFTGNSTTALGSPSTVAVLSSGQETLELDRPEMQIINARAKIAQWPADSSASTRIVEYGLLGSAAADSAMNFTVLQWSELSNVYRDVPEGAVFEKSGLTQCTAKPWKHLSNSQIKLSYSGNVSEDITIKVFHYYHQITQVSADNGQIVNTVLF